MDAIRRRSLRFIDGTILVGLNAGKIFGFLGSGRESVDIDDASSEPSVRFPNLSDEGWPGFTVPLPLGANFQYAAAGMLTRIAIWQAFESREDIATYLESRHPDLRFARTSGRAWGADLPEGVKFQLSETSKGAVLVIVRQVRDPESIGNVLRARYS
jgi:hypothetical protein